MIIPLGVFRLTPKRCPKMAFPGMIAIDFPHISAHFQGSTKMISICLGVASNSSHNSGVPRIAGDINVHEIHHKDMFKYDSSMSSNFKTYISIIWENYKITRQISYHILQKVAYYTVERRRVTAKSAPSAAWRQIFFPGGCHIFGQNMLQNVKKSHMVGKKSDPRGGHWASNLRGFMGIGFKAVYKRYARVVVHDQRGPCLLARRSEQQVMPPMRFTYDLFDLFVSQFAREKTTSHILLHWFARMLLRFFLIFGQPYFSRHQNCFARCFCPRSATTPGPTRRVAPHRVAMPRRGDSRSRRESRSPPRRGGGGGGGRRGRSRSMSRSWRDRPRSPVSRAFLLMGDNWEWEEWGWGEHFFLWGANSESWKELIFCPRWWTCLWPIGQCNELKVDINIIQHVLFEFEWVLHGYCSPESRPTISSKGIQG